MKVLTKKLMLFCILFVSCNVLFFAQERITDIKKGSTQLLTYLSTYDGQNFVITVSPFEIVNFYRIETDNSHTLVRSTKIPFSYSMRNSQKLIKEKYFVVFSDKEIYNYNFIDEVTQVQKISNPRPEMNTFSLRAVDQESVYFSLYNITYIYYYRDHQIETVEGYLRNKYDNHLAFEIDNDIYYSSNFGNDKRFVFSVKEYSQPSMYENYMLGLDSSLQLVRYNYGGALDTLLLIDRPNTYGISSVGETQDFFIIVLPQNDRDSTIIEVYNKITYRWEASYKIYSLHRLNARHVTQYGMKIIIHDSRSFLSVYDINTQNHYTNIRAQFGFDDKFFISNGNLLFFTVDLGQNQFRTLDLNTLQVKSIFNVSSNVFSGANSNQWIYSGDRIYYNKPGSLNYNGITLYTFNEDFSDFKAFQPEVFYGGVDLRHPLVKVQERTFLCTDDLYEIFAQRYQKINEKPLAPLILNSIKYISNKNAVIYAEENGANKDLYCINGKEKFHITKLESGFNLKDIIALEDYVLFIGSFTGLTDFRVNHFYLYNLSTATLNKIYESENVLFHPNFFKQSDSYFFFVENRQLKLIEPNTGLIRTLSIDDVFYYDYEIVNLKGVNIIFGGDAIYTLNSDFTVNKIPNSDGVSFDKYNLHVQDDYIYFGWRDFNNSYVLSRFDGQHIENIYESYILTQSSTNSKYLVFQETDSLYNVKSYVYDKTSNRVFEPQTQNDGRLKEVFVFRDSIIALFHTSDSLYLVKYNQDFSNYDILYSAFEQFSFNSKILGTVPNDRALISTDRKFLFLNENFKVYELEDIVPNRDNKTLLLSDSIYYFMAIGTPLGNQVYSFNHLEYSRLVSSTDDIQNIVLLAIFPNPTAQYINFNLDIDITDRNGTKRYDIINANGRIVKSGHLENDEPISIEELGSGVYFIRCVHQGKHFAGQFIKI